MPSAVVGISINRSAAFGKRVAPRSPWPSRCATASGRMASTSPISTRSRASLPTARLYERFSPRGSTSGSTRGCVDRRLLAPLIDLDPAGCRSWSVSRASRARRSWRRSSSGSGRDRVIFSLDLDEGCPRIVSGGAWSSVDPIRGSPPKPSTAVSGRSWCSTSPGGNRRWRRDRRPYAQGSGCFTDGRVRAGGGIHGMCDLDLRRAGASAVLVGSALHDGRIGRRDDWSGTAGSGQRAIE